MYGNDWHKISSIVATQTFTQIQTHAQKYHAKNNAEIQQKYQERLLFDTNTDIQKSNTAAHHNCRQYLSPDTKARIQEGNTAAQQKRRQSLSSETKAHMLKIHAEDQIKYPLPSQKEMLPAIVGGRMIIAAIIAPLLLPPADSNTPMPRRRWGGPSLSNRRCSNRAPPLTATFY